MPDRLSELVRQRALVSDHLAWLDREIANTRGANPSPIPAEAPQQPASVHTPSPLQSSESPPAPPTAATANLADDVPAETESLLDQYRVTPAAVKEDVRKGCLLYFVGSFVVLGIVIAVLYFTIGTR